MKTKVMLLVLALGASTCLLQAQDTNQVPDEQRPPRHERGGGGFHLLPPHAQERLNLTADQQKQVADLEAEVRVKLEKILTPQQLQQLKQMRPPRRQGGPGGPNGAGMQGNDPGPDGPGGEDHPQPPAQD
jgi:Spy/CpxP family protein refolding chaperone